MVRTVFAMITIMATASGKGRRWLAGCHPWNGVLWQENTSFLWYAKVGNVPGSYRRGWQHGISFPRMALDGG